MKDAGEGERHKRERKGWTKDVNVQRRKILHLAEIEKAKNAPGEAECPDRQPLGKILELPSQGQGDVQAA